MNHLKGTILNVYKTGSISLLQVLVEDTVLNTVLIETPQTLQYYKEKREIQVCILETDIVIGKGLIHSISIQNKVIGTIFSIEKDEILSKIKLITGLGNLYSILATASVEQMELKVGEEVTAMIKSNEIMITE